jgi:hypothetical protein
MATYAIAGEEGSDGLCVLAFQVGSGRRGVQRADDTAQHE